MKRGNLFKQIIVCIILSVMVISTGIPAYASPITSAGYDEMTNIDLQWTGKPTAKTISEYLSDTDKHVLYWTPVNKTGFGGKHAVLIVLDTTPETESNGYFYAVHIKGVSWGWYVPTDDAEWRRIFLEEDASVESICKIDGTKAEYIEWIRAYNGNGYESRLGKYTVDVRGGSNYVLTQATGYGGSTKAQYDYDDMYSILDGSITGDIDKGVTKYKESTLKILEGTLRAYCDNIDINKLSSLGKGSSGQTMKWLYTEDSDESYISIVTTVDGFKLHMTTKNGNSGDMDDFLGVLSNLSTSKQSLSKYPYLKTIVNSFGSIESSLGKAKVTANNTSASSAVSSISKSQFNNLSAYKKWINVAKAYVASSGTITTLSADTTGEYGITKFKDWIADKDNLKDGYKGGSKTKLTQQEIMRIKSYFYLAATKSGNTVNWVDGFDLPTSDLKVIQISGGGYERTSVKKSVDDVLKDTQDSAASSSTISSVSLYFDLVAKYLAAKVYGYSEGNPFEVKEESNESLLETNEFINSVVPTLEANAGLVAYDYYPPKASNLLYINDSENAVKSYAQLQYALMLVATYANTVVKDKDATTGLYTCATLDKFLKDNAADPINAEMSEEMKALVTSFTQIHKGLDYLGVTPFTQQLKAIDSYYNQLLTYSESAELKAYDPSKVADEPMRGFFSIKDSDLNYYYKLGVALSSTYIPMQTNLYDTSSLEPLTDLDFVSKFHYAYGFYRKALYIDTNIKSAVDYYVTGKKGTRKVATLNDLLQPEKDICLYLDTNFYNVNKLADMQGYTYNSLANTEEAGEDDSGEKWYDKVANTWSDWFETNIESITKTGDENTYSKNVKRRVSEYGAEKTTGTEYVLSDDYVDKYLTAYSDETDTDVYDEYTPLQAFAVVSAIYRDSELYKIVSDQNNKQTPVFISSPTLASISGIEQEQWNTIYNYLMLKNLKGSMAIDYKTTLDLDSPIYMDIYGNIVTESGIVVIPAASNSTLYKSSNFTIYNAGFLSLYSNGYHLPAEYNNSTKFMGSMFAIDEETKTWELSNKKINNLQINFKDLPLSNEDVLNSFMELMQQSINNKCIDFNNRVWLMTEVLRGAPIENINKEFEGLKGNRAVNKYGIYLAYKIDELSTQLLSNSNGNSLVTLPNLAYVEYVEYVVLFIFKITFAFLMLVLAINTYNDAVHRRPFMRSAVQTTVTLICFVAFIYLVPKLLDFSYYQTNKRLLQKEVEQIELLNLEKKSAGKEIGVYEVGEPETQTELYLKVDSLSVPWYKALPLILNSSTFATMSDIYQEAFENNLMAGLDGVIKKANGLYVNVDDMLASTGIEYSDEDNTIYNHTLTTPYVSYCTPYYVILDQLVARVNEYNTKNDIKSYTTKIQNDGAIKTLGMTKSYFSSSYFMEESQDVLGLKAVYGIETTLVESSAFSEAQKTNMVNSMWYANPIGSEERQIVEERLTKLDNDARAFVVDNYSLLGKVTDETFLKVMALSLSVKYNQRFKVPACSSIEIFNIDTRDIMRLSIAKSNIVLGDSSKSFARFAYDNSGTLGVVAVAFLIIVYFISSLVKPVSMLIILGCVLTSLIIRRIIKRDKNKSVEGFITTMAILCLSNLICAGTLKISLKLPDLGFTPVVCILLQILLQIIYIGALIGITVWVIQDWANLGWAKYEQASSAIMTTSITKAFEAMDRMKRYGNRNAYDNYTRMYDKDTRNKDLTGKDIYSMMKERDRKREKEYEENR